MKAQARVKGITIGRLYNLGNYEHIRYEIALDLPEGASAARALRNCEAILGALKPQDDPTGYKLSSARQQVANPPAIGPDDTPETIERKKHSLAAAKKVVSAWDRGQKRSAKARDALDKIGGAAIYTDAKERWDSADDEPF